MKKTGLLKRFFPYLWRYKQIILADLFCAALTTLCALILPLMIRDITDRCLNDIGSLTVTYVLKIGGMYLALCLIDALANYYTSSFGHIMGSRIETDMRSDLFSHLQRLSFSFYDEAKVGQLMSRMTNDLFDIAEFSHHCPEEFFIAGIKIIASFIILGKMNFPLTLIIFACLPVMLIIARYQNKKMRHNFRESRVQIGELNAQIEDSLLGIRVVKSFANEQVEHSKFESGNRLFLTIKRVGYFYMANFHTTIRLFDGLMNLLVVVVGSVFVIKG
ncbi:MAG: ABC transporter ATP-binding protein, partial [Clostridia bacterium]|nr:ABC transporter ATP-binding protein [Clostridia bacterium]